MGIQDLIHGAKIGPGVNFATKLSKESIEQIDSDLREVVEAEIAGKGVPAAYTIARFINQSYNESVHRDTIVRWLDHIRGETNAKNK